MKIGVAEMFPLHQSCICKLSMRTSPKLFDAINQQSHRLSQSEDNQGNKNHGSCNIFNSNYSVFGGSDGKTGNPPKITSEANLVENGKDDNVILWDLRQNLEKNSVFYLTDASHDGAKVKLTRIGEIAKYNRQPMDEGEEFEVSRTAGKKYDGEKSQTSKKARQMRHIKKYCEPCFKSCQDKGFQNSSENPTDCCKRGNFNDMHADAREIETSQMNRQCCRLSVPGDEQQGEIDQSPSLPAESSSCSITPDSLSSDSSPRQFGSFVPDGMTTSIENSDMSSNSGQLGSITRLFRRTTSKQRVPSPLYCGYSLERDYCVDLTTDIIFKKFLNPKSGESSPLSKRTSALRGKATHLRRQLMRKQYSDSAAVYYGQRIRRWQVQKQRSDSINCPVDRAALRRQERINEEYYPKNFKSDVESRQGVE